MEAEKYKGSWIRQKKRVAELECSNSGSSGKQLNGNEGGGSDGSSSSNRSVWNDHFASSNLYGDNGAWGGASAAEGEGCGDYTVENVVELRKVTPNISNDEYDTRNRRRIIDTNHTDEASDGISPPKVGHAKRKYQSNGSTAVVVDTLPSEAIVGETASSNNMSDSVRQRVARLILSRDEMGCHAIGGNMHASLFSSVPMDDEAVDSVVAASMDRKNERVHASEIRVEREIRAFVKSILYQMAEAPDGLYSEASAGVTLSPPGLCHVLLVRFNSLFNLIEVNDDRTVPVDGAGDHHAMELESDPNPISSPVSKKIEYQRVVLLTYKREGTQSKLVTHAPISWRAVLYLLSVIQDILLVSDMARDDLRRWLYQSQQSAERSGKTIEENFISPTAEEWGRIDTNETAQHPRIEGLHPIERVDGCSNAYRKVVLSTTKRKTSGSDQPEAWDPISMKKHGNEFFELIVGLMKGNVRYRNVTMGRESSNFESEQESLPELVQLKAIELVSTVMSDADPDFNTDSLWSLWFEALFPSSVQTSDIHSIGDFFSPWEKSDPCCTRYHHGSGRKHSTRRLTDNKFDAEKISRNNSNRGSRGKSTSKKFRDESVFPENVKVHDNSAIPIKCQILRLLSHIALCSHSVQGILYQSSWQENKPSLAKRILAAVLDCMEDYIVPLLSPDCPPDIYRVRDTVQCIRLCFCCLQFLTLMARSKEGVRLLRMQMRLESGAEESSRWSQSAIGCVTCVLSCTLDLSRKMENEFEVSLFQSNNFVGALNAVVGASVHFFSMIRRSVEEECTTSQSSTLATLVSEHITLFEACCQRILAAQSPAAISYPPSLLHVSDELRNDVRDLLVALHDNTKKHQYDDKKQTHRVE